MTITEKQIKELGLTPEQIKAAKAVYKAMKTAHKLKVAFWDNYGTLTAFNSKKITVPHMVDRVNSERIMEDSDEYFKASSGDGAEVLYYENLNNFFSGNADDTFFAKII